MLREDASDILCAVPISELRLRRPDLFAAEVLGRRHVPFLDESGSTAELPAWLALCKGFGMNIGMIRAAADRSRGAIRCTPLLSAPALNALAARRVLVKAECLQHTGSFKGRGGWAAVTNLPDGSPGVLAISSSNRGQGVAWAAARRGLPCVVLMPADALQASIGGTCSWGAQVVLYDRLRDDRDALGARLAKERGLALIPPFDHPEVIAG